jgi:ABC-type Fe3+ transport system permease subunit
VEVFAAISMPTNNHSSLIISSSFLEFDPCMVLVEQLIPCLVDASSSDWIRFSLGLLTRVGNCLISVLVALVFAVLTNRTSLPLTLSHLIQYTSF